jgi:hypothetical protein
MITWNIFKKKFLKDYDIKPNSDFALKLECAFYEMEMEISKDLELLKYKYQKLEQQNKMMRECLEKAIGCYEDLQEAREVLNKLKESDK